MSVKVTFEFDTAADAAAFLLDSEGGEAPAAGAANSTAGKPRGRPRKDAAAAPAAAPTAAAPAAATAAAAPAAGPTTGAVSGAGAGNGVAVPFKDVADAITDLAEADRDAAVALLASFGAQLASQLKPAQYADVVKAARAKLAPPPAAAASLI